jgi:ribosome production factor 1
MRRKREEQKRPELREERLSKNVPATIESKRVWDEPVGDEDDALGWAIDVERLAKRQKTEEKERENEGDEEEGVLAQLKKRDQAAVPNDDMEMDEEADSMLDSDEESDDESDASSSRRQRAPSPSAASTSATNMNLSPEFLMKKFPQLFPDSDVPPVSPRILVTTSIASSLHKEAEILCSFFPNSTYIRRTRGAHGHRYSVREIASFASKRGYTALVVLMQAGAMHSQMVTMHGLLTYEQNTRRNRTVWTS